MGALTKHEEQSGQVATPVAGEDAWLSMIERAARDPAVDVSKMERMFEMRERVMKSSAEQAFNAAFVAVRAAVGPILKNKNNQQTSSRYADLFAIADVLDPIMTENGFAATFGTAECPKPDHYRITGTLLHAQGHSKEYHVDVPADTAGIKGNTNKTATHAFGSTMTYGRRYLKVAMFDLAITDNDGNRRNPARDPNPPPYARGRTAAPDSSDADRGPPLSQMDANVPGGVRSVKDFPQEEALTEKDYSTEPEWAELLSEMEAFSTKQELAEWWKGLKDLKAAKPHMMRAFYRIPFAQRVDELSEAVVWEDEEEAGARG